MRQPPTPTPDEPAGDPPAPRELQVALTKGDFLYFNWVLALERPVLPFFLYGFVFFNLASLLGLWPAGRLYALAILVPAVGYSLWLTMTAAGLWQRLPRIAAPRLFRFRGDHYEVVLESAERVGYGELQRVLESRRGIYLLRPDGSYDLLPRRCLPEPAAFSTFLRTKAAAYKRSTFL